MNKILSIFVLFTVLGSVSAKISFSPTANLSDISIDTIYVEGIEYHQITIDGFPFPMVGVQNVGAPSIPFSAPSFLLHPNLQIDTVTILSSTWEPLSGKYYLYPAQTGILSDTTFVLPDSTIYNSSNPFPDQPVEIIRQGSAMGYSVVTLSGTPVRYIPADSTLEVLTKVTLHIKQGPSEIERIFPNRETEWSAAMRERGILSLITNPEDLVFYQHPNIISFEDRTSYLNITQAPSPEGDGVDMVIITSEELVDAFEQLADYRTQQGIITVVRTVEWIDQFYSGCDTPERIRNFIRDAHEEWGIQAVILGGDDDIVPVRECRGWNYNTPNYPLYQLPSDDYYADIDGEWSYDSGRWLANETDNYLDLCAGRWSVDDGDDVDLMFIKLKLYEWPDDFPEGFARKLLVIASSDMSMDDDMRLLICQLEESIAIPEYLDGPTELYYPGDLRRSTALDAFDQGYNLIIHADHSGVHEIGTAAKNTLWQVMWDSDLATMSNSGEPSILWTLGCDPGWFDGADCFSEAGLLASENTGLVAAISNSRYGMDYQCATYYAFCDALFNTGWIAEQPGPGSLSIHWPLSYLGEAHRCSKNHDNISFLRLNLLGSPLMYVWRDDPGELTIMAPLVWLQEGIPQDITVTVLDGVDPFENATVCLWKKDEIFSVEQTNARGRATFEDVCVADGNHDVLITAVKRRRLISHIGTTVVSYIPDQIAIDVLPSNMPIVLLEGFSVDANGDGTANPGETVDIYLTAKNSGGETAQNVTAELSLVSGGEYIESIPDNQASFPDIAQDQTEDSMDPFTIVVNSNVESYSTVEFNVTFTYYNNNGRFFQWESPLFLTIYSEGYQLTVVEPTAASSGAPPSVITLSNMFLANCGLGEGSNLEITVDNLDPPATYIVNTLTHPGFGSNEVEELSGEIVLNVMASHDGNWFNNFDGCSFDVVVTSEGGEFVSRNVNVGDIWAHQGETLDIPTELQAYEVGQDYISLVWNHSDNVPLEGFYVYYADGYTPYRAFPLPVPVEQATIENLLPGTEYEIQVTAVDIIGRESDPVSDLLSTTCPAVDGWPIQLEGSPGGGAAIADIDQDGSDEIVVATSFGFVYIIERDGSYYTLTPPSGYDFDKFLGCAVGDVDGDSQLEIVVSCQKKIEIEDQEQVAILLFDWNGLFWNVNEITTTEVNEEVYSPYVAGTPVIFQADDTEYLEIALRTRRSGTLGTPHLYVWRYDHNSDSWDNYSTDFPVLLDGSFFNAPTSVDFDEDGYEELIVTTWGSGSVGTALIIVDFEGSGVVSITTHELPDLDYQGIARVFGTLAAATENGEYYITGAATKDAFHKRVFVYTLDTNPVGVTSVWMTEWMNGRDSYSNIPGPSIGDLDGDSYLEVIYTLNGGLDEEEGLVYAWNLVNGNMEFQSDDIPFNPIIGGGHVIKSQPVVGLTTTFDSNAMAVFSGFSSYCCGHDLSNQNSMLTGFPSWTRDGSWAAPAICDLNGDNYAEVLYIDYSGYATLFDWNEGYFTIDGWHIYQDNPHRNGFYNYNESDRQGGLDISVSRSYVIPETRTDSRCYRVIADVDITGISSTPAEESAQEVNSDPRIEAEQDVASVNRSSSSSMTANTSISRILTGSSRAESSAIPSELSTEVVAFRTVEVVAFCGDRVIGSETIPLESGFHRIEIPFRTGSYSHDDIRIVADPFNDYIETDESNNTSTPENIDIVDNVLEVFIPSPAGAIELTLNLPHCISHVLTIRVYSVDGRLVTRHDMEDIQAGRTTFLLTGEREFPTGMYTVCIEGLDTGSIVKKVIILND